MLKDCFVFFIGGVYMDPFFVVLLVGILDCVLLLIAFNFDS